MTTRNSKQKILHAALVKIILGVIIVLASVIIGQQIFLKIPGVSLLNSEVRNFIKGVFVSILAIGSYWLLYRKYEHRVITELSTNGLWKKLFTGIFIGSGLQLLTILVIYLFGGFSIIAVNTFSALIISFTVAFLLLPF